MRVKFWIILGVVVALILGAIGYVVIQHKMRTSPMMARKLKSPMPVEAAVASQREFKEIVGFNAQAQPFSLVNLSIDAKVVVTEILAEIGEEVRVGQKLLMYDPEMVRAQIDKSLSYKVSAEHELKRAEVSYKELKAKYDQGILPAVALARASADIKYSKDEVARALSEFEAVRSVVEQGLLSQKDLDDAQTKVSKAEAELARAEEQKINTQLQLSDDLEEASAAVETAKAQLLDAEEELMTTQKYLAQGALLSPVDGVVLLRQINANEMVSKNSTLMRIGRLDTVLVAGEVSEMRSDKVAIGDFASVRFNAYPNELREGKIARISPNTNSDTRSFTVYIKLNNPGLKIKSGMSCFVRTEQGHSGLGIPSVAVISPLQKGGKAVFVVEEDKVARLRPILIGAISGGWTQVLEGIQEGESIVVVGQVALRDGDKVILGKSSQQKKGT